jgi:hypothetical protein
MRKVMAMERQYFEREYPRVRSASSGMTRNHSQDANPRTGNRNVGRAAVALVPSDRGDQPRAWLPQDK